MSTLIIAEAGVNHNGDLDLARKMVRAASQSGADVVKFQTFSADRIVTQRAQKADYQARSGDAHETQHAMLRRLELSEQAHRTLVEECADSGIEFLSTGFDEQSVDLLASLGLTRFKIPSGEITNLQYLRHVGSYGREVLLSTGMATLDEVGSALEILTAAGTPRTCITVLQCNSAYPTPASDANLRAMTTMREVFGIAVGFSDHTVGIEIAIAAAALGASVIEKHFTVDRGLPGPDQDASLEPGELKRMVAAIRNVELALGDGVKRVMPSEAANRVPARKSLVAARSIRAGELFDRGNVSVKRPGTGLSPMMWDEVVGRPAPRDFAPDDPIEL